MRIRDRLEQFKAIAVVVIGFVKRPKRASIAVDVVLLIGTGGGTFFLNLVGLGIGTLIVRGIMQTNERRKAAHTNCRFHCHRQPQKQQSTATP